MDPKGDAWAWALRGQVGRVAAPPLGSPERRTLEGLGAFEPDLMTGQSRRLVLLAAVAGVDLPQRPLPVAAPPLCDRRDMQLVFVQLRRLLSDRGCALTPRDRALLGQPWTLWLPAVGGLRLGDGRAEARRTDGCIVPLEAWETLVIQTWIEDPPRFPRTWEATVHGVLRHRQAPPSHFDSVWDALVSLAEKRLFREI